MMGWVPRQDEWDALSLGNGEFRDGRQVLAAELDRRDERSSMSGPAIAEMPCSMCRTQGTIDP